VNPYSRSHVSDSVLPRDLAASAAGEDGATATFLADLAEFDARKLYLPAGYPSMYAYCIGELRRTEQTTYKRIRVARTALRFPAIFMAIADGRLDLTSIILLAPHLTEETAEKLLAAAVHKTRSEIVQLLAQRFPRLDVPARVQAPPTGVLTAHGTTVPGDS